MGLGALGCPGGQKKIFQTWSCGLSNRRGWSAEQNASNIFILGSNLWPWGEVKGQISLNFGYHVNFKDFYTKFCVCSHKWKIQNMSDGIFILLPGSCPRGGTLGRWGAQGAKNFFFQTWSCGLSNRRGWSAEQNASNIFILGSNMWPWGEVKGQISLNFCYHVNFKDFLYQILCVFSQMKDTKHVRWDFYSVTWVMPQGWDFGALGVPRGSNISFSNMVM